MTESEAAAQVKVLCDKLGENDSIGGHTAVPPVFKLIGTLLETHHQQIKSLQAKLSKLEHEQGLQ